eukprot:scaffold133353_cov50-Phaeocystis_antarctica.AAC.2
MGARRAMKPIRPSVPLTRPLPSFRLWRNSRLPSFARPPLQPHPQPGHSLGTRACAVPNYSKFSMPERRLDHADGSTSSPRRFRRRRRRQRAAFRR